MTASTRFVQFLKGRRRSRLSDEMRDHVDAQLSLLELTQKRAALHAAVGIATGLAGYHHTATEGDE